MKVRSHLLLWLKQSVTQHWPVWVAVAILWAIVGGIWVSFTRQTSAIGPIYILDDAYIHMAMARHFSQSFVFGVTPYAFSSSSSSLLWTVLLALGYRIFGVSQSLPLVFNLFIATGLLVLIASIYYRSFTNQWGLFFLLIGTVVWSPMIAIIFSGMEHLLQALVTIGLLFELAAHATSTQPRPTSRLLWLAPLAILVRFESCALILPGLLVFTRNKQWKTVIQLGGLALLPIVIYAGISLSLGWLPFPNSVILKATNASLRPGSIWGFLTIGLERAWSAPYFSSCLLAVGGLLTLQWPNRHANPLIFWFSSLFLIAAALHLQFGLVGLFFFRYETYLVITSFLAIGLLGSNWMQKIQGHQFTVRSSLQFVIPGLLLVGPGWSIGSEGTQKLQAIPQAMTNVYQQQYQMGRFLARYYSGQSVAANDIGAINYLGNLQILDLAGLASMETARLRLDRTYTPSNLQHIAQTRQVRIAVLYEKWFVGKIPSQWIKVGEWQIPNNIICGDDRVAFFAVVPDECHVLRNNLIEFSAQLPPGVKASLTNLPSDLQPSSSDQPSPAR